MVIARDGEALQPSTKPKPEDSLLGGALRSSLSREGPPASCRFPVQPGLAYRGSTPLPRSGRCLISSRRSERDSQRLDMSDSDLVPMWKAACKRACRKTRTLHAPPEMVSTSEGMTARTSSTGDAKPSELCGATGCRARCLTRRP